MTMLYREAYYSHVFWRFTWGHEEVLSCASYLSLPPNQLKINIWLVTWNLWNTVANSNTSGPCGWPQIMLPYRISDSGNVTIPELWVLTKNVSSLWAGILGPLRAYLNYVRFLFTINRIHFEGILRWLLINFELLNHCQNQTFSPAPKESSWPPALSLHSHPVTPVFLKAAL